jgi:hypothetical protein
MDNKGRMVRSKSFPIFKPPQPSEELSSKKRAIQRMPSAPKVLRGEKKRTIRRLGAKGRVSLTLKDLNLSLETYLDNEKRIPSPLSPPLPLSGPSLARAHKAAMRSYVSSRRQVRVVETRDESSIKGDPHLIALFRKGIFNEDNDTDESIKQTGVQKGLKFLKEGLDRVKRKRKPKGLQALREQREEALGKGPERSPLRERAITGLEDGTEEEDKSSAIQSAAEELTPLPRPMVTGRASDKEKEKSKKVKKD